ncbi:MAG: hypothetical protein ABSA85_05215 [Terracidiphilus sp.]
MSTVFIIINVFPAFIGLSVFAAVTVIVGVFFIVPGGVCGAPSDGILEGAIFDFVAGVAVVIIGAKLQLRGELVAGHCEVDEFDGVVGDRV